ncbi:ABC transporter permease [Fulvivirgaceae bacterium BMA12]|uniref:ABC transporter permease n=1 Tax=Agaribacillus aureus TaxID=3051825 RepID=A0ABT8L6S7_9BACT|nr:ABC transporter permease [Fulvivirgaceae bacterium BMA12]
MKHDPQNHISPPKWPLQLLKYLLENDYLEEIEGDLAESFEENLKVCSRRRARTLYIREALRFLRPGMIGMTTGIRESNRYNMFKHYLLTTCRNFWRHKSYSFLNLIGLTAGLIAFILIVLYVQYEFSFDQHHQNKDRIYRVIKERSNQYYMGTNLNALTRAPMAPTLMEEYPEVEAATRLYLHLGNGSRENLIGVGNQTYLEKLVFATDPQTFEIFSFKSIAGNPENFLKDKFTAVITRSVAAKYFGDTDPMGKTLKYLNKHPFTIVGIVEDMPENSHFRMEIMLDFESMAVLEKRDISQWSHYFVYTYLLLHEGASPESLTAKFPALLDKYTEDKLDSDGQESRLWLQKFSDIHLHSKVNFEIAINNEARKLYIFLLIGFLILLIACINYVNLSTANALRRAKEIGIRKAAGASRRELVFQFLCESGLLSAMALLFSLAVIAFILPYFSQFVDRNLSLNIRQQPWLLAFLAASCLLVGVFSGLYPAFVLSSFRPVAALKGYRIKGKKSSLRNALVVIQFTISAALIISALVISKQLNYIRDADMGYAKDQIVILKIRDRELGKRLPVFKDELRKLPGILQVASANSMPNNITAGSSPRWPGQQEESELRLYTNFVDYDYTELFELEVVRGRDFSREFGDERKSMLLNESAVKALGWEDPIGRQMLTWADDTATIVGIIKDFHQHSLHLEIAPLQVFFKDTYSNIAIKVSTKNINEIIESVKEKYGEFSDNYPFEYSFFNELFERAYLNDIKTSEMANWFSFLIIIIACLGLYGLSSFIAELHTKEVGIRKVFGASIASILMLLSRDFMLLVLLGFVLAVPIAYHAMSHWLDNFAYHTSIGFSTVIWALLAMLLITIIAVGHRIFKAALNNPVSVLYQE